MIDFELNTRLCDSEVEMATESNPSDVFDLNNPEGPYSLNLAKAYDQIVLQNLLSLSHELCEASAESPSGAFEQKMCFQGVKYNGKSNWAPPAEKLNNGLWDLSAMETGTLNFNFAVDPVAYKKEQS